MVSCEPSGPIDLRARRVSTVQGGAHTTVGIELELSALPSLRSVVIEGSVSDSTGNQWTFDVPGTDDPLASLVMRRVDRSLDLQPGIEHHVFFTLLAEDEAGATHETTAYLKVNLDPSRKPTRRGDLLQYQAVVEGW